MDLQVDKSLLEQMENHLVLSEFQRWLRDVLRWHIAAIHEEKPSTPPNKADYDIIYAEEQRGRGSNDDYRDYI